MSDAVLIETVRPGIALVTLNRPERLNAMNYDLVRGLHDALDELAADRDVPRDRAHRRRPRLLRRARPHRGRDARRRPRGLGRAQAGMTVQKYIAGPRPEAALRCRSRSSPR